MEVLFSVQFHIQASRFFPAVFPCFLICQTPQAPLPASGKGVWQWRTRKKG